MGYCKTSFAWLLFIGMSGFTSTIAFADVKCECRWFGQNIPVGQTVCMATANGTKVARCEMMQNNPSWSIEDRECPLAINQKGGQQTAMQIAAHID